MNFTIPYLIVVSGVISDWVTTHIGLSRGFYETHPTYTPVNALLIFTALLLIIEFSLGNFKYKRQYQSIIACMSFLGTINNTLVLFGFFGGLVL